MEWLDAIEQFITNHKVPIGDWGKSAFDWFTDYFQPAFDAFTNGLDFIMQGTVDLLTGIHPLIFIVVAAALAFAIYRTWQIIGVVVIGLLFALNIGFWQETIETLVLTTYSTTIALLIGLPVGVICARRQWLYTFLRPILDMMQVIPTFVYLIPALVLFGLGPVPGLVATVIFAVALPIRTTYIGISEVNKALVEAGESFGCTNWQLLAKVRIPAALPTIMIGVNQTIMLCLSMVVIAAMVGADGLGVPVMRSLGQVNVQMGIESGLTIVALAIILDRIIRKPVKMRPKKKVS